MKYITLDTCVWLELLKIDLHNENNVFEEISYWIENKFLTHITPENIIREWDRNKVKKTIEIINQIKSINKTFLNPFKGNIALSSVYQPDVVEEIITKRIDRIEAILKTHSEIATENPAIYDAAIKRNLNCLAPNHSDDSFRDTINILTLINYIKSKGFSDCYFSTINYSDFSAEKSKKHELHQQLVDEFQSANLQYVFFDEDPVGGKLINVFLRPHLPSFQDFLKEKERIEQELILEEKKRESMAKIENPDKDYLENIKYIDLVLSKKVTTAFENEMIQSLIKRHNSYKQYFLRNVGNNGVV
jgi:hypothetical protein